MRLLSLLLLLLPQTVFAQIPDRGEAKISLSEMSRVGEVAEVLRGNSFVLKDGEEVVLADLGAPFAGEPLFQEARAALTILLRGRRLHLLPDPVTPRDRYGRLRACVEVQEKEGQTVFWVRHKLLEQGWAYLYTHQDQHPLTRQYKERLSRLEETARRAQKGLWGHQAYQGRRASMPGTLMDDHGRFVFVEGIIKKVSLIRGRLYLNFGEEYRTDFTLVIEKKNLKSFEKAGFAPFHNLQGKRVRARGVLEIWNGPLIRPEHPDRLEVLESF